jgi:hypothetical protein
MRLKVLFTLLVTALGVLAASGAASATHVRPKAATPLRNSLVIAQQECIPPATSTHGAPLAFASCNPPQQTSKWLTAGTPDANGAPANFIGHVRLIVGSADVNIDSNITDVRCLPPTSPSVCTPANSAAGPDYVGKVQIQIGMRITDHNNSPSPPATVIDIIFPVDVNCVSTTSVSVGSTCGIVTSMNALVPGSAPGTKRTVYQIPQRTAQGGITVWDGGMNGVAGSSDATLYAEPGVFLP